MGRVPQSAGVILRSQRKVVIFGEAPADVGSYLV